MLRKAPFVSKLLGRLDKLSPGEIRSHFEDLLETQCGRDQILEAISEGVVLFESGGKLLFANRNARAWIFASPQRSGRLDLFESVEDPPLAAWLRRESRGLRGRVFKDLEILLPEPRTLRAALASLEEETPARCLLTLLPLEEASAKNSERLYEHLEAMVRLSAGIAHEIGNPLNAIAIHLELLRKEIQALPEAKRKAAEKYLAVLQAETSRLDGTVKNFLKAARKPPLRFKMENLNEILDDALNFLGPELKRSKVSVLFEKDESLPLSLADRERLRQVFINLIKNAMEACAEKGRGRLEIRSTGRGKAASFRFKDDGPGIPEENLSRIFDAYFTTKKEGSGLGLMTVYQNVREHGGRIDVETKLGKGSQFTVFLPIRTPKLQIPEMKFERGA